MKGGRREREAASGRGGAGASGEREAAAGGGVGASGEREAASGRGGVEASGRERPRPGPILGGLQLEFESSSKMRAQVRRPTGALKLLKCGPI